MYSIANAARSTPITRDIIQPVLTHYPVNAGGKEENQVARKTGQQPRCNHVWQPKAAGKEHGGEHGARTRQQRHADYHRLYRSFLPFFEFYAKGECEGNYEHEKPARYFKRLETDAQERKGDWAQKQKAQENPRGYNSGHRCRLQPAFLLVFPGE